MEAALSADLHNLQIRKNIGKAKGLLHSLVPRAQCFCFYDADRQCLWSSDGADDYEIDSFVVDLPDEIITGSEADSESIRRTLKSGRTLLGLPVEDSSGARLGLLVAVFSRNAGKSSSFNPNVLVNILRPAVDLIGESLLLGRKLLDAEQSCEDVGEELTLVYEVDEKIHRISRGHAGFAQLVGHSGRFLGIGYSVLLIPSKRIRVSATHPSVKNVDRKVLDRYLIDHMLPKLKDRRCRRFSRHRASMAPIPGRKRDFRICCVLCGTGTAILKVCWRSLAESTRRNSQSLNAVSWRISCARLRTS